MITHTLRTLAARVQTAVEKDQQITHEFLLRVADSITDCAEQVAAMENASANSIATDALTRAAADLNAAVRQVDRLAKAALRTTASL